MYTKHLRKQKNELEPREETLGNIVKKVNEEICSLITLLKSL